MTLGKGLGGGVPLAALLATEAIACFHAGDQGGTFNGNPLMTAVGAAILDTVRASSFLEQVRARGEQLHQALLNLSQRFSLGEVRGQGLLQALALERPIGARLVDAALEQGLLINAPRPDCLRLMPALNVSAMEIVEMTAMLQTAMTRVL
jgi:acetylornithine/N-succinyldiaminopimelate aminotransferase